MMRKCIFVIGPESSGSMLIAKICSHVLGIHEYGTWDGVAWSDKGEHKVCHRSLPYGSKPPKFPNIEHWISQNEESYEVYFILTTRDITISELSRFYRFLKPLKQSQKESEKARDIMTMIINSKYKHFIWSYETFMFLKKEYLNCLYKFLDMESEFIPNIVDSNSSKVAKLSIGKAAMSIFIKLEAKIKNLFMSILEQEPT
ncbi:MAG: hypothetical protein AAGF26_01370 [Cyanobacteria bacterium P01_G01_bin.49]